MFSGVDPCELGGRADAPAGSPFGCMQASPGAEPTPRRRRRRRSRGPRVRVEEGGSSGMAKEEEEEEDDEGEGEGGEEEEEEEEEEEGGEEEEEAPGAAALEPSPGGGSQVVRVRRELLAACMTCPLCQKLLRDATTISECLHTFCRKCIYEKLTDEEVDCCPICNIDLGCTPVEKLRPDHNLQDVRAKIFPFKRRKVKAPEVLPSISLPIRRKERSLSSLVVSAPRVATQNGLTGRRTKVVTRKSSALRGLVIDDIKKEDYTEDHPEASSSAEPSGKISNKRQNFYSAESSHMSKKDGDNTIEPSADKTELWKPLNCLVEAANRTKSLKFGQGSLKSEQNNGLQCEINSNRTKTRGDHLYKSKLQDDKNNDTTQVTPKVRRMHGVGRRRGTASRDLGVSAQALLDAASTKRERSVSPIWFSLIADSNQEGDAKLPQIPACYLRIKDASLPASFIQKYLAKKLDLMNETEVEITCRGQPVVPTLALHNLVDLWLQTGSSQKAQASVGTSAKDFVMVLAYARKVASS